SFVRVPCAEIVPMVGGVFTTPVGATYVKALDSFALSSPMATTTSAGPEMCWVVVAVMDDALATMMFVLVAPPMVTLAPAVKFAPEIVTAVPPNVVPLGGEMAVNDTLIGVGVGVGVGIVMDAVVESLVHPWQAIRRATAVQGPRRGTLLS